MTLMTSIKLEIGNGKIEIIEVCESRDSVTKAIIRCKLMSTSIAHCSEQVENDSIILVVVIVLTLYVNVTKLVPSNT